MNYRYFMVREPAMPGSIYPENVVEIHEFEGDYKTSLPWLNCRAWGWIDYSMPIPTWAEQQYGLCPVKTYYVAEFTRPENGYGIQWEGMVKGVKQAVFCPKSSNETIDGKTVIKIWFPSLIAAQACVADCTK